MKTSLTKELEMFTRTLEEKAGKLPEDSWRLKFHVMPPVGWLNDPNGLCWFHGAYHLFFQYSPSDPNGALKYWGHYVSENMLTWEYKGIALYPDMPYDCNGVYSGSALVEGDQVWLYYTGNVKLAGDYDYIHNGREGNTVAAVMDAHGRISDKKLLMKNTDYPSDLTCHVRDPKVWKENGRYFMVLGARKQTDRGCVLLYSSRDRISWTLANVVETREPFGYMWECPDVFLLEGQRVLSVSPQGLEPQGLDFANLYQSGYFMVRGNLDGEYALENFREWDRGFDFYAPQTFEGKDGRRILIGWMGMPDCDYVNHTVSRGWQHCMTIPRELTLKDGRILQNPVRELEDWRREERADAWKPGSQVQAGMCSDLMIESMDQDSFKFCIDDDLVINYDKDKKIFSMEFLPDSPISGGRTFRGVALDHFESLRILLDTSALELYINEGQEVFSTRIYPDFSEMGADGHWVTFLEGSGKMTLWKLEETK
ncbi:MAG TPA: glycoside hydrolase family 32 protein [Candidatus Scybalocola faecavium]|nr:glycoside hydrolase family 32 protein [Candidatus Scybalocola faecavium]